MGIIITNAYYREPTVLVIGKYNRLVTINKIREIINECKTKYGEYLDHIEIRYEKKKDGISVKAFPIKEDEIWKHLSFKKQRCHVFSTIIFSPTQKDKNQERWFVNAWQAIKETDNEEKLA